MAFINKSLLPEHSRRRVLRNVFKNLTIFFVGASCVLFLTRAFEIVPDITNVSQIIEKILLTSDGSATGTTGIYLDGSNGNITTVGDVGIGTSTPTEALDVTNGNLVVNSGDITANT